MTKNTKNAAPASPAVKVTLLTTVKAIEAAILSIHERGTSLQTDMHIAACSVMRHLGKHKDIRIVMKLLNAMPDMARKNSLMLWFETFGAVKFEGKEATFVKDKPTKMADAMAKPFWKFKANEGVPYEALDVVALINSTIKKLEKDTKETKIDHTATIHALRMAATIPSHDMH
jgi:hypothetical protein